MGFTLEHSSLKNHGTVNSKFKYGRDGVEIFSFQSLEMGIDVSAIKIGPSWNRQGGG